MTNSEKNKGSDAITQKFEENFRANLDMIEKAIIHDLHNQMQIVEQHFKIKRDPSIQNPVQKTNDYPMDYNAEANKKHMKLNRDDVQFNDNLKEIEPVYELDEEKFYVRTRDIGEFHKIYRDGEYIDVYVNAPVSPWTIYK